MNQTYSRRKRVEIALSHREPDKVPCDLTIAPDAYRELCSYMGIEFSPYWWDDCNHAYPSAEILEKLNIDVMHVPIDFTTEDFTIDKEKIKDPWGLTRQKTILPDGSIAYVMIDNPLKDAECVEDVLNYNWPSAGDLLDFTNARKIIKDCYENTDFALTTYIGGHVFEGAHFLRGIETMLVDFYEQPEIPCAIMDKMLEINMEFEKIFFREAGQYLSFIRFNGEDVGTQNSPMLSLEMFDEFLKPRLQKEWRFAKQEFVKVNPVGKVGVHTCGSIYPFISRFIEMGADFLNPIQPNAAGMDTEKINKNFGDAICFHGGIDTQNILVGGDYNCIREEVKTRIKHLAPGGGYICAPSHNIQYGMTPETVITLYQAIQEFGKYPICFR